ncbi:hypothetical protein M3Y94_00166900 [Aphelenchoides besseyi]|nr:hypothetical protein M3Y94_00166900 [Aphelenchoides besseyi]
MSRLITTSYLILSFSLVSFGCQPAPLVTTQLRDTRVPLIAADPPVSSLVLADQPLAAPPNLFELLRIPTIAPVSTLIADPLTQSSPDKVKVTLTTTQPLASTSSISNTTDELLNLQNSTNSSDISTDLPTEMLNGGSAEDGEFVDLPVVTSTQIPSTSALTDIRSEALRLLAGASLNGPSTVCKSATVTAITLKQYNENQVGVDLDQLHQQIQLLEAYAQRKLASFGDYSEEAANIDGHFSLRFNIKETPDCGTLRDFATKAVSYSREIERISFTCHCEPTWIIAKRRSG